MSKEGMMTQQQHSPFVAETSNSGDMYCLPQSVAFGLGFHLPLLDSDCFCDNENAA